MRNLRLSLLFLFAASTFCLQSCGSDSSKQEKPEKFDKIISGKYIYLDKNDVFHIDADCIVLTLGGLKADENKDAVYSVMRFDRDGIDWKRFASDQQLCAHCFTDEVLDSLEAHQ
jgi:hypothetical protein